MQSSLAKSIQKHLADSLTDLTEAHGEITIEVGPKDILAVAKLLRDHDDFQFEQLIDLCGVDYLNFGKDEWQTQEATASGFSRGRASVEENSLASTTTNAPENSRFAVVYHLLSVTLNQRLRVRVFVDDDLMQVPSVIEIWNGANWYEREAFDLFGILFEGHPDLRRILTDYGFIGHPFRKDFPVIGELEMRYDEALEKCIYEPVSIEERILVPKVIRKDRPKSHQKDR